MHQPQYQTAVARAANHNRAALALFQILSVLALGLYIASSLLGDFFNGMGYPLNQPLLLAAAVGFSLCALAARMMSDPDTTRSIRVDLLLPFGIGWFILLMSSLLRGYQLSDSVLTYGPLVAIGLSATNQKTLMQMLTVVLLLSLLIQFYEIITGRYLFVIESFGLWLDESVNSGTLGFVRSKGLFSAPTVAAGFAILCFSILPRSRWLLGVILITGVLTTARTAFLFGVIYAIGWYVFLDLRRKAVFAPAAVGVVLASLVGLTLASLDPRIARLTTIGVAGDSSNIDRFKYLISSINLFKSYDVVEKLLGAPRETYRLWVGATESQPLQFLVDTGIMGFILYLGALTVSAWRLRFETAHKKSAFAAFCAISVFTQLYNQSGMNILFWLYMYSIWTTSRTGLDVAPPHRQMSATRLPWERAGSVRAPRHRVHERQISGGLQP